MKTNQPANGVKNNITLAVERQGYDTSRLNAMQHGILSRFVVLPWEDATEYQELLDALTQEHSPVGPTEVHLVEELAGVIWRKRRLRLAEAATHNRSLKEAAKEFSGTASAALVLQKGLASEYSVTDAIDSTPVSTESELAELEADEAMTRAGQERLDLGGPDAYQKALSILHESTRAAWEEQLTWEPSDYEEGTPCYEPSAASLKRYLKTEIETWYAHQRNEIAARPMVRAQALGESLDPDKLDRLGRYEVHLDRKLERTLSTLLRLQEIRVARAS